MLRRSAVDFNAFVHVAKAAAAVSNGSLQGLRVAVKDNIMVAGMPMRCGSGVLNGHVPEEDATSVRLVRQAGAVVVGKTNMDEFGMGYRQAPSGIPGYSCGLDR